MFARVCAGVCALAAVVWCGPASAIDPTYFQIDPSQSVLFVSASIQIPDIGLTIPTVGQGTQGPGVPLFSNGASGQLEGTLAAEIDWDTGSIVLGGGSLHGRPSGIWEPMTFGEHGIEPAFLGVFIQDGGPPPTRIATAFRDFFIDYRNAYSTSPLTPAGSPGFSFPANEWFDISTNVDVEGQAGLGLLLPPDRLDLNEPYAARNNATGSLLPTPTPEIWQIRIPVNTSANVDAGEVDGIGPIYVNMQIEGTIVGNMVPLPPQTVLPSTGANESLAAAQPLDGHFELTFDPNVGNEILNTSAGIPHVTVEGTLGPSEQFFKFTVTNPNSFGIFDVDGAEFDSQLFLFDELGNLLAANDDAPYNTGSLGSTSSLDAFLQYTFAAPGVYTIAIGEFSLGDGLPQGGDYRLNVSLTNPVPEPSSLVLAAGGPLALLLAGAWRRRRRCAVACAAIFLAVTTATPSFAASVLIKQSIEDVYDRDGTYPMPYRLFTPPETPEPGQTYPLVLFLHGAGERGEDNYYQVANHVDGLIEATQSEDYRSFLLAPQMTDFPLGPGGWNSNSPFDRTIELLTEIVQTYPVDPTRIYITGLSMGGFGTFHYMAAYPDLWAAAVPLSGGGSTGSAPLIKDIPLWVFHGALDATVSVNNSRNMVNAITAAGGSPLYTELPTGGHDIWGPIYDDADLGVYGLYDWMFAQSNPGAMLANVPEPGGVVLAALGAAGLAIMARRHRSRTRRP